MYIYEIMPIIRIELVNFFKLHTSVKLVARLRKRKLLMLSFSIAHFPNAFICVAFQMLEAGEKLPL